MAGPLESPLDQTKMGVASLIACIVQTLSDTDEDFQRRFLDHLESAYAELRHKTDLDCLELLIWTRETLQSGEFGPSSGS